MGVSGPLPWAKGKRLVADEAVNGRDPGQDRAGNIAGQRLAGCALLKEGKRAAVQMTFHCAEDNVKRGCVVVNHQLKEARQRGERDKAGNHAGAVDGEAFEALDEIVALRAEDEELVGKVGDGDGQRQRQYRRQHNREVQEAGRQNRVEQRKNDGEAKVAKNGVEYPDTEVTDKLAAGEAADEALEPLLPGKEGVLRNRYNRW